MKKKDIIVGTTVGVALAGLGTLIYYNTRSTIPEHAHAIKNFNARKYLGKWYEIARMDFYFEKNLINATAEYSLRSNGTLRVVNRGYNVKKKEIEESIGKARFVNLPNEAMLKVSFFGPFYAGYNVVAIDPDYNYALVVGRNLDYMWILSREKTIPEEIRHLYLRKAQEIGYDTNNLVWTEHRDID